VASFRFEEKLMGGFIREFDHLVFNGGAISRTNPLNSPGVQWRPVQVGSNDFMRFLGGVRNPAGQLFHVELTATNAIQCEDLVDASTDFLGIEGEPEGRLITELNRATRKINRSPIHAARRPSLESPHLKTHLLQVCAQA